MQRIAELRKEGLWAAKRLPKVQEPPRQKTQWDYLLEEMQWLATDFAQERRWKRASARKVSGVWCNILLNECERKCEITNILGSGVRDPKCLAEVVIYTLLLLARMLLGIETVNLVIWDKQSCACLEFGSFTTLKFLTDQNCCRLKRSE